MSLCFLELLSQRPVHYQQGNTGCTLECAGDRLANGMIHVETSDTPSSASSELLKADERKAKEKNCQNDDISNARKYAAVLVLFLINLLNYMDRFTIAGNAMSDIFYYQFFCIVSVNVLVFETRPSYKLVLY